MVRCWRGIVLCILVVDIVCLDILGVVKGVVWDVGILRYELGCFFFI